MNNTKLSAVAREICSNIQGIDYNAYCKQLDILYGDIDEAVLTQVCIGELIDIEKVRLASLGLKLGYIDDKPLTLCKEYSDIAFALAQRSLENDKAYEIAKLLKQAFETLIETGLISAQDKQKNQTLISETILDFGYAGGNHDVASLRMVPLIRGCNSGK